MKNSNSHQLSSLNFLNFFAYLTENYVIFEAYKVLYVKQTILVFLEELLSKYFTTAVSDPCSWV